MRTRPAARLLIMSPENRLLLFRFSHRDDALAGRSYWATPGGGVEEGELFADARETIYPRELLLELMPAR